MPPAHLEPIDPHGMACRVLVDGEWIGTVRRNTSLGESIWQIQGNRKGDEFGGVFTEAREAADQLEVDYVNRKKR